MKNIFYAAITTYWCCIKHFNKNENERVIKKALGLMVNVSESILDTTNLQLLNNGTAWRILPSGNSIGFFIAVLEKSADD